MATARVEVAQLAAEAAQPVDRQRVEQSRDGARREQRLLVWLVQAAAQLGEQLVGRHARRACEAQLPRHLAPCVRHHQSARREQRLVVAPLARGTRPPPLRRLVDAAHHLPRVARAEGVAREDTTRLRAPLCLLRALRAASHVRPRGGRRVEDLGHARRGGQRAARRRRDVDVDLAKASR